MRFAVGGGAIALVCLSAFPAIAEPRASVNGWVAGIAGLGDEDFADRRQALGLRGQIEGDVRDEDVRAHVRLLGTTNENLGDDSKTSLVREAWVRGSTSEMDLTVGRQLFPEGKGDWIRPQAHFAPRDYSQLTPFQADQRLGLPAVRLDYFPTIETTVTIAGLLQDRGDVLYPKAARKLSESKPWEDDPVPAGLLRLEYRWDAWELGASASVGASPRPTVSVVNGTKQVETMGQRRLSVDGSYSPNGDVLRWDVAFISNDVGSRVGLPSSEWLGVIGYDRRIWADSMLNLQLIHHHSDLAALSSQPYLAAVEIANRRRSQTSRTDQSWVTANLRQQIRETHEIEVGHLQGEAGEAISFLRWTWSFRDRWQYSVMGLWARGSDDMAAGSLSPSTMLFTELRFHF